MENFHCKNKVPINAYSLFAFECRFVKCETGKVGPEELYIISNL